MPTPGFAEQASRLLTAWTAAGDEAPSGSGLALALRAAARATVRGRERDLEVVWTGPDAGEPVRLTAAVVDEVIGSAAHSLIVLSYASYRVPAVEEALKAAAGRGVRIDLVLETAEDSAGRLEFDAAEQLGRLESVTAWHWPADERPQLERGSAALHAKAIIADARLAFVTSANLTGHALTHNIELGLLVRDRPTAASIGGHVRGLMRHGTLRRLVP